MQLANQGDPPPPLLVIAGPTATGKTRLALDLADHAPHRSHLRRLPARSTVGFDVGTAKPTPAERKRVPHHLVDIIDPDETFSAHRFTELARTAIAGIESRGARPVLVGGTGFYIQALLTGSPLGATAARPLTVRDRLTRQLQGGRPRPPHPPPARNRSRPRRRHRPQQPPAASSAPSKSPRPSPTSPRCRNPGLPRQSPAHVLGLEIEPEILAGRIAQRTERMFKEGLLDEARRLRDRGYARTLPALSGVGYAEALAHLDGYMTLPEAIQRTTIRTRQYARRQRTWFRHQLPTNWNPPESRSRYCPSCTDHRGVRHG